MYSLKDLMLKTCKVEILSPQTQEPTGIILEILPTDNPKIKSKIAEVLGSLPPQPEHDTTNLGPWIMHNTLQEQANRSILAERIVKTNTEELDTAEKISQWINDPMLCPKEIIDQIDSEAGERSKYFS